MDHSRLKPALKKAFLISTSCFTFTIVLIAAVFALSGEPLYPSMIIRPFLVFTVIFILNTVRIYLAESKWAFNKPYIVINIMFMPLYLITAMTGLCAFNNAIDPGDLIMFPIIFLIVFTITQIIKYMHEKSKTDKMNDALNVYHKEHSEYGEEI